MKTHSSTTTMKPLAASSAVAALTVYTVHESPLGPLILSATADGVLNGLWIIGEKHAPVIEPDWQRDDTAFDEVRRQLDEYFAGTRQVFDLPLTAEGTAFQQSVWAGLRRIPCGVTKSYGQLAEEIGNPKAVRAVGLANGRNPISIIVPCHRIIGANGTLTGYGGGLKAKSWLLEHENRITQPGLFPV